MNDMLQDAASKVKPLRESILYRRLCTPAGSQELQMDMRAQMEEVVWARAALAMLKSRDHRLLLFATTS
jgi:hypothetical protein